MDVIDTHDLVKAYGATEVLHRVNLRVPGGSLFGFLGPNGAGKTTTIRILLGLLRASAGSARMLGQDAWKAGPRVRAAVGYLPGDVRFYDHLTGRATLRCFDAARGGGAQKEKRTSGRAIRPEPRCPRTQLLTRNEAEAGPDPGADASPATAGAR